MFPDARSAVSVPPGAAQAVEQVLADAGPPDTAVFDAAVAERLANAVAEPLSRAGLEVTGQKWADLCFACNASLLRPHSHDACERLVDDRIPPAEGLRLPEHCFPDGIVYGIVVDGEVASYAFAHPGGPMEAQAPDLGVVTAPAHRRRGYARAVVSAVVEHITGNGGEARYVCRPDNAASIATAKAVGFVPHDASLVIAAGPRAPSSE